VAELERNLRAGQEFFFWIENGREQWVTNKILPLNNG
jgi:hypothetical protein